MNDDLKKRIEEWKEHCTKPDPNIKIGMWDYPYIVNSLIAEVEDLQNTVDGLLKAGNEQLKYTNSFAEENTRLKKQVEELKGKLDERN